MCQGSPSLHSQHQTAHCCAVHPHVCNNHSKCAIIQSCSADFLYTLRAQLFVTVAAQEAVQQHFKRIHYRWQAHSDQCPLRRSSHTGTSLLSAFMLFSRHSFISAFSLQACCNVQLIPCIQPSCLSQGTAPAHADSDASLPCCKPKLSKSCARSHCFPFFNLCLKNEALLQVKVRRRGSDMKYVAQVLAVGTECDIGRPACRCCATYKLCSVGCLIKHICKVCSGNHTETPCWSGFVSLLWASSCNRYEAALFASV